MAEKEERIYISKTDSPDGFRDENATVRGYTVQEAIEKMAKDMNEAYINRNKDYIFHFGLLAEAALNALLGASND